MSIIEKESARIQSKYEIGTFFAILQVALFYIYWPAMAEAFWKWALNYMDEKQMSA